MDAKLQNSEYDDDGEEHDTSELSDDDIAEEVLQKKPRPNAVYNLVALHEKLEEIGWPDGLDWRQSLSVDYTVEEGDIDVNDDLSREMAFYTQALEGTREAFIKFLNQGDPFLRPPDYYAEMVKSDSHMLKVKDKLLFQQKRVEESEEHRKAREAKKFSKEVQAIKLKQRAQEKKHNIESVKKWRKMRQQGALDNEDEAFPFDLGEDDHVRGVKKRKAGANGPGFSPRFKGSHAGEVLNDSKVDGQRTSSGSSGVSRKKASSSYTEKNKQGSRLSFGIVGNGRKPPAPWDRSGGKNINKGMKGKPSFKRQSRNAKYGHGGKKSFNKANTAESSAGHFKGSRKKGRR